MRASTQLIHPRYWATWLGVACGWLTAYLPYSWQMVCGRLIGVLAWHTMPYRRQITHTNIALCFPNLEQIEQLKLAREHFQSLGMGLIETAAAWWSPGRKLTNLYRIEGTEYLERALDHGKGVILLSAHFTTLELGGRLLALCIPFHVLYREHKNPVFEHITRNRRIRHFECAIPRSDMRGLLRSLKDNMPVWYAPDQNYGHEHSIFAPFFGIPAATITATSRIARASGAKVVPFFPRRLPDGRGYQLNLLPALDSFPSGDDAADARHINSIIETAIRQCPEQYLWAHRRFKTRPPGAPDIYAQPSAH